MGDENFKTKFKKKCIFLDVCMFYKCSPTDTEGVTISCQCTTKLDRMNNIYFETLTCVFQTMQKMLRIVLWMVRKYCAGWWNQWSTSAMFCTLLCKGYTIYLNYLFTQSKYISKYLLSFRLKCCQRKHDQFICCKKYCLEDFCFILKTGTPNN